MEETRLMEGSFKMSLKMVNRVWQGNQKKRSEIKWLPFLDTYRTMCLMPGPAFRQVLEQARAWA
jgi:hypothetical protein